jgi:hypothetical protein
MGGGKRKRTTIKKTKRMRTRKMRKTKRKHWMIIYTDYAIININK